MNLAQHLVAVSRRDPDAVCFPSEPTPVTYGGFVDRVLRLAAGIGRGVVPGDRVVLLMENGPAFFECLFACWAAGLVAVPVNAKLHAREVAHIVGDAGTRLILTTPGLAHVASEAAGPIEVVCAATDRYEKLARAAPSAPHASASDDLAWIFYTSGTTGRPKGAMLSHRNLLAMSLRYFADIDHVGADDVHLYTAPVSHGSGLYGLPFFLKGARHVILPGFDVEAVVEALARFERVSFFAAPTMLTRLVNSPAARCIDVGRLRTIYYGGGPMYVADLERALTMLGPRLYQLFGQGESPMTITGLDKVGHVAPSGAPIADRLASCGVPRTGVSVRVVDRGGCDLPPGEVGEVVTRSDCVMLGYWNNPEASANALKDGWLHTGDLGSFDGHGLLTLRDRSKDMIISGGANIYPREVEEVLLRHPGVVEVSVVGHPSPDWGEEVVAFVVAGPGWTVGEDELDRLCLDNIARFKRPKRYRFVEQLPKNNYGKVLKTDLRSLLSQELAS